MAGYSPRHALQEYLRRGGRNREGLDDLAGRVQQRRSELLGRHKLDGTLNEVQKLLDTAVLEERKQLARDAMMDNMDRDFREMQLQNLPESTAAAVNELASYDWQSSTAREAYERIKDLLGRELLDQRFAGMKEALEDATEEDRAAVAEMLQDLNELLDKHRRGEDTDADFQEFMAKHGQFFPENPQIVEELVDALAQRAAAAQRLLQSMSAEQREELMRLSAQAFGSPELMAQLGQLDANLQALRPGEDWSGSERFERRGGARARRRHRRAAGPRRTGRAGRTALPVLRRLAPGRPGPGRPRPPARAGRRGVGPDAGGDRAGHARRRLPAARRRRRPPALPAGHAAARQGAAAGHRQAALRPAGPPGHPALPARPGSRPAPAGSGSSATPSRGTSPAPSPTRSAARIADGGDPRRGLRLAVDDIEVTRRRPARRPPSPCWWTRRSRWPPRDAGCR